MYDGDEELLPRLVRSSESLTCGQVSRQVEESFPVEDADSDGVEEPVGDNTEDDPKPDVEASNLGGLPLKAEQKPNLEQIHNNCVHPSRSGFSRCLRYKWGTRPSLEIHQT